MDETTQTVCYWHPDRKTRLSCSECGRNICVECTHDAAVGQRCPECAAPQGRNRVVVARRSMVGTRPSFQTAPVTLSIIAIAATLFVAGFLSRDLDRQLLEWFAQANWLVAEGEWWRTLSGAFLHGGLLHIGFNMYILYALGPRIESQVGSPAFASLYLASAAAGGAAFYLIGPDNGLAVGASGAIFGVIGSWLFVAWKMRATPGGRAMLNQLMVFLVLNAAIGFMPGLNIAWEAHLGGFLAGLLIAYLWSQFAVGRPNAVAIRTTLGALVGVASLVLILLF